MNKLYTLALLLSAGTLFISCETESSEIESQSSERLAPVTGKQLRIINNSDFKMSGEIYCYGAQNNMSVSPNILIMGNATVPANTDITYKNFAQSTNLAYRINPWYVTVNGGTSTYNASNTNQVFGQLYHPGISQSRYANWRYLKAQFTTTTIPGLVQPISMNIELPLYSSNNSGEVVVDLAPYGLDKHLHLSQSSLINSGGNTILIIESELVEPDGVN
ncbi:MAG TPA: hypothetical protein VGB50_07355 [Flavobacterium sp.]|jgi:hypothetical protein